jgi:peptidoglycan/LPS O-acetylase OafA/YrhL
MFGARIGALRTSHTLRDCRMAQTIAEHARANGRTTGFDYLRIILSLSIILWHGISLSYGTEVELAWWRGPVGTVMHFVLPMFFALSGFLVAGSLDRCPTLVSFSGLRILRIVPALAVEVTLSALVFGPVLTSYQLGAYFSDPRFAHYFLNMVGDIHYQLPGLFGGNPIDGMVNAQLWTIPFELQCYLAIGGLATAAILHRRSLLLWLVILGQAMWAWRAISLGDNLGSGGASGAVLVISFLVGILFHLYRDRIQLRFSFFLIALAGGLVLSTLPHGAYYLPIPATYVTVWLGLRNPRMIKLVASGDYSYGLYLYGYPFQQAVASIGPATHHWWINIGVALPAAFLIAILSWHGIERPMMAFRRRLPPIEAALVLLVRAPGPLTGLGGRLPWQGMLTLVAILGGGAGTLLLINANEGLAVLAVLGSFAATALLARLGVAGRFSGLAPRSASS